MSGDVLFAQKKTAAGAGAQQHRPETAGHALGVASYLLDRARLHSGFN